ncbi:MAG: hemerythrin domain-containing protein [Desulfatibacillaceae bacterium]|nr:hemerythrin domain-containing protein [Desulfatibacillaceae bacterium]
MKPTEELVHEHHAVLEALGVLEQVVQSIEDGKDSAYKDFENLLDFFKGFVDRCHHGKEEDALFPAMMKQGVKKEGGPIGVLLAEHEDGRKHVRAMAAGLASVINGNTNALVQIRENALSYRELLFGHIEKENNVLFPMAERVLSEKVKAGLVEKFERIERERTGEGAHEAYHTMLEGLIKAYGKK